MRVFVVSGPEQAVSLADAKQHLKVSGAAEDVLINGMIAAATQALDGPEGWLGRALGAQTLEARFSLIDCGASVRLPYRPVNGLVSVKYLDRADNERSADLADFELLGDELVPVGAEWVWMGGSLRREAVRVQYRAGYQAIPAPIRTAILLMVGDLYRNRETVAAVQMSKIPMSATVESLLRPLQVYC